PFPYTTLFRSLREVVPLDEQHRRIAGASHGVRSPRSAGRAAWAARPRKGSKAKRSEVPLATLLPRGEPCESGHHEQARPGLGNETRDTKPDVAALAGREGVVPARRGEEAGTAAPAPAPDAPGRAAHDLLVPLPHVPTLVEGPVRTRRARVGADVGYAAYCVGAVRPVRRSRRRRADRRR